jgi:hypothetical protein
MNSSNTNIFQILAKDSLIEILSYGYKNQYYLLSQVCKFFHNFIRNFLKENKTHQLYPSYFRENRPKKEKRTQYYLFVNDFIDRKDFWDLGFILECQKTNISNAIKIQSLKMVSMFMELFEKMKQYYEEDERYEMEAFILRKTEKSGNLKIFEYVVEKIKPKFDSYNIKNIVRGGNVQMLKYCTPFQSLDQSTMYIAIRYNQFEMIKLHAEKGIKPFFDFQHPSKDFQNPTKKSMENEMKIYKYLYNDLGFGKDNQKELNEWRDLLKQSISNNRFQIFENLINEFIEFKNLINKEFMNIACKKGSFIFIKYFREMIPEPFPWKNHHIEDIIDSGNAKSYDYLMKNCFNESSKENPHKKQKQS